MRGQRVSKAAATTNEPEHPLRIFLQKEVLRNAPIGRRFWYHIAKKLLFNTSGEGFVAHYRVGQALAHRGFKRSAKYIFNRTQQRYNCYFHPKSQIGLGLRVPHPSGIVVGLGVTVGDNCSIYQNVTLGAKRQGDWRSGAYPSIGSDVLLSAGSVVLGTVMVGNGARIGANAVVLTDIPGGSTAVGVPAKIKSGGSRAAGR